MAWSRQIFTRRIARKRKRTKCTKVRQDIMSKDFPSILLEIERKNRANMIIGGFYREWTRHNNSSKESQMESMKVFTQQIIGATNSNKPTIMLGDANLCINKWENTNYPQNRNCKQTERDIGNERNEND